MISAVTCRHLKISGTAFRRDFIEDTPFRIFFFYSNSFFAVFAALPNKIDDGNPNIDYLLMLIQLSEVRQVNEAFTPFGYE